MSKRKVCIEEDGIVEDTSTAAFHTMVPIFSVMESMCVVCVA